jgi:phosphopantothenoylcysteine decarboxylase / phosphopantothenate---cysteine ligase
MTNKSLSNLADRKVLLGVSGGIAAYKILSLTSKLRQSNAQVEVILTRSAKKLVTPTSFQAFTGRPVRTKMFTAPEEITANHIHLANWAQLYVIAPATANTIAKLANGFANNLLTCAALAVECPILIVPAMNTNMWNNRIVQDNVRKLKEFGFHCIGPATGHLACGTSGDGRMVEPEDIYDAICDFLNR